MKKKIPARYIREANNVIKVMRAFKRGEPIEKQSKWTGGWVPFDFQAHVDTPRIHYRVKPKRNRKCHK